MNTDKHRFFNRASVFILVYLWFLTACAPRATSTPFRPPTKSPPTQILPTTTFIPQLFTAAPETPTAIPPTAAAAGPCANNLTFVDDATIPDGTVISPGSSVDKQWLVTNSGTCNWDSTYRLKWIGGDPLGAVTEQALYPARAGTQVTLRIIFTAPFEAGTYGSTWQAFDSSGVPFGDTVYMEIVIQG